ncbi:MAG: UDP-N-acetylmuramate--L-alanine ligase [Gammaproteobacteria bacterium]|nr:UDP-N-acetylmuramate--L-alanine ligase [Gammaproteobacteria bacterium]
MGSVRSVHFVGIGGTGMCGIAELLVRDGFTVTGSDLVRSEATDRLAALGATIRVGHAPEAVVGADVVVTSSAVDGDNTELVHARDLGLPVVARAEMLAELMRHRHGIAVAGTHGKTTTASLIASVFRAGELDPTYVIGAPVPSTPERSALNPAESNAGLGRGRHLIAEADESDASFLHLSPVIAVVTNIDRDHMDAYAQNFDRLLDAFVAFGQRLPFYGTLVVCADDPHAVAIPTRIDRAARSYGFNAAADFRAVDLEGGEGSWRFTALRPSGPALRVSLPLPGRHNVQNAMAAIAVAAEEGIADEAILDGLRRFKGVGRRFETADCIVAGNRVTVVDDYGHHPTEVARVVETARELWPDRRLVMAYQPHRYTRTRDLHDEFVAVLGDVDRLLLLDVYAAGEEPIEGADSRTLARDVAARGNDQPLVAPDPGEATEKLRAEIADDDVVLVQGAGDVSLIAYALREEPWSA